jgi:predicted DNA-binding antitoxin AbrB/MazE fold protein
MPKTIIAVYEDGVFKPLRKPMLKDKQRVTLEVCMTTSPGKRRTVPSDHPALKIVGLCDSKAGDLAERHDFYLYGASKKRG